MKTTVSTIRFGLIYPGLVALMLLNAASHTLFAQQGIGLGQWRVHLPYKNCFYVAESEDRIYASSEFGFFAYDKEEHALERLSTVNGFSDVDATVIEHDPQTQKTWIAYNSTRIDVVYKRRITPLDDIFRSTLAGDKSINHIYFHNRRAYIATGIGIVVYDQDRMEVVENYLDLGQLGNSNTVPIYATAVLGDTLFAAAGNKIIFGLMRPQINLADFNNWSVLTTAESCRFLAAFRGKLYTEIDEAVVTYDGNTFNTLYEANTFGSIQSLKVHNGYLAITLDNLIALFKPDGTVHPMLKNGSRQALVDHNNRIWHTTRIYGLLQIQPDSSEFFYEPNGPNTATSFKMLNYNNAFWVTAGGHNFEYVHTYNYRGYNRFVNNTWHPNPYFFTTLARIHDFTGMAKHPNKNKLYIATHGKGVVEFEGDEPVNVFKQHNSSIQFFDNLAGDSLYYTTGIAFDLNENLWVTNYNTDSALHVLTPEGVWKAFRLPTIYTGELLVDANNRKWMITPNPNFSNAALCVFDDNGTPLNDEDDRSILLNTQNAELPTNLVRCMIMNPNNEIWLGTDAGLVVIRNPSNVFRDNPGLPFRAERIIIEQEGVGGYLLGSEVIYAMHQDGAGRIWVGTNKGAWLIARNGREILKHYNEQNSPLPSDNVYSVGVDEITGEVFFGTDKGLFSVKGDATAPVAEMEKLKIFPNPVRPDFNGDVAIEGLALDARVKITDINGNVVYETISNGGRATWNCKTFSGKRPATGVYLVFAIDALGEKSAMGKLLFVR